MFFPISLVYLMPSIFFVETLVHPLSLLVLQLYLRRHSICHNPIRNSTCNLAFSVQFYIMHLKPSYTSNRIACSYEKKLSKLASC